MTEICVICGYPVADGIPTPTPTCSDRCKTELDNREEIALSKRRAINALHAKPRCGGLTREEITTSVMQAVAQVILERDIPVYTSCRDLDTDICVIDPSLKTIPKTFRKRQITTHVEMVYYRPYARAGRGRVTFMLSNDKEIVRHKLEEMTGVGMTV